MGINIPPPPTPPTLPNAAPRNPSVEPTTVFQPNLRSQNPQPELVFPFPSYPPPDFPSFSCSLSLQSSNPSAHHLDNPSHLAPLQHHHPQPPYPYLPPPPFSFTEPSTESEAGSEDPLITTVSDMFGHGGEARISEEHLRLSGKGSSTHPGSTSSSSSECKSVAARELTAEAALRKASCMESGGRAQTSSPASSRRGGRILSSNPVDSPPLVASMESLKMFQNPDPCNSKRRKAFLI